MRYSPAGISKKFSQIVSEVLTQIQQLEESIPGISDSDKIVVLSAGGQLMGDGKSELVSYKQNHRQFIDVNTDSNAISIKDLKELLNSKRNELKQIKETNSVELE
ncbi:TPA: hypothetical protein ACG829_002565 [Enterococcus faecium]